MHASASVFSKYKNLVISSMDNANNVISLAAFVALIALLSVTPASVYAVEQDEEDWWFDVEIVAFKRNVPSAQLEEDFSSAAYAASRAAPIDLISLHLYQRANPLLHLQGMLYECSSQDASFDSALTPLLSPSMNTIEADTDIHALSFETLLTSEERLGILLDPTQCGIQKQQIANTFLSVQDTAQTSTYLAPPALTTADRAHLLDDSQLALVDYAKKLFAQRDIQALSHLSWRQPVVFGEENASFFRVFAGKKLTLPESPTPTYERLKEKYDADTSQVIDQNSETFFAELNQQLEEGKRVNWIDSLTTDNSAQFNNNRIDDVWELDGKVKVYLKYINRVPYLHVESEFQFHEIQLDSFGEGIIEQYPFKQRRRIISKQIHYFDHPKIGIVIRLQRFEKPQEVENENIY